MSTTKKSNVLNKVIPKRLIDFAETHGACYSAREWLRAAPRTWKQLYAKNPWWFVFGARILLLHGTKPMRADALKAVEAVFPWPKYADDDSLWYSFCDNDDRINKRTSLLRQLGLADKIYYTRSGGMTVRPEEERRRMVLRLLGYDV